MDERCEIYMTPDGVHLVSGNVRNLILDMIIYGGTSISNIVSETGIPKSTVFSNINKLASEGLIRPSVDEDGGRIYRSDAIRVITFCKKEYIPDIVNRRWDMQMSPRYFDDTSRMCLVAMLAASKSTGVDCLPAYLHMGMCLAEEIIRMEDRPIDDVLEFVIWYLRESGVCHVEAISRSEYLLRTSLSSGVAAEVGELMCTMGAVMIAKVLTSMSVDRQLLCGFEETEQKGTYHAIIGTGHSVLPPNNKMTGSDRSMPDDGWPRIYLGDYGAVYVTGLQSHIIDALGNGLRNLPSIASYLNMPLSTVSFNLRRLNEMGLVERTRNGFVSNGLECTRWCRPRPEVHEHTVQAVRDMATRPRDAHRYFLFFTILDALENGMDMRPLVVNTGRALAIMFCSRLKEPTVEYTMDNLCNYAWWFEDCDLEVVDEDLFTVMITCFWDMPTIISETFGSFYATFFCEVLRILNGGVPYRAVDVEVSGEGNRVHRMSFVPAWSGEGETYHDAWLTQR